MAQRKRTNRTPTSEVCRTCDALVAVKGMARHQREHKDTRTFWEVVAEHGHNPLAVK